MPAIGGRVGRALDVGGLFALLCRVPPCREVKTVVRRQLVQEWLEDFTEGDRATFRRAADQELVVAAELVFPDVELAEVEGMAASSRCLFRTNSFLPSTITMPISAITLELLPLIVGGGVWRTRVRLLDIPLDRPARSATMNRQANEYRQSHVCAAVSRLALPNRQRRESDCGVLRVVATIGVSAGHVEVLLGSGVRPLLTSHSISAGRSLQGCRLRKPVDQRMGSRAKRGRRCPRRHGNVLRAGQAAAAVPRPRLDRPA